MDKDEIREKIPDDVIDRYKIYPRMDETGNYKILDIKTSDTHFHISIEDIYGIEDNMYADRTTEIVLSGGYLVLWWDETKISVFIDTNRG